MCAQRSLSILNSAGQSTGTLDLLSLSRLAPLTLLHSHHHWHTSCQAESVSAAAQLITEHFGGMAPTCMIYNVNGSNHLDGESDVLSLTPEFFEASWRHQCFGSFLWAKAFGPAMVLYHLPDISRLATQNNTVLMALSILS